MNASIQVGAVSAFLQKQADNRGNQEKEGKARSRASEGGKPKRGKCHTSRLLDVAAFYKFSGLVPSWVFPLGG